MGTMREAENAARKAIAAVQAPEIAGALSPMSRASLGAVGMALSSAGQFADQAYSFALDVLKGTIGQVAGELGASVAELIPLVGSILSTVVSVVSNTSENAASGSGPASNKREVRAEWSRANYAPVRGSGWQNEIVAADIFAPFGSVDGLGDKCRSSLGSVLIDLFETDWQGARKKPTELGIPGGSKSFHVADTYFDRPGVGIPAKDRAAIRAVREAIEACWKVEGTDGGNWLWPTYLDLLTAQVKAGRIDKDLAVRIEGALAQGTIAPDVADPDEYAYGIVAHERRGLEQAWAAIEGWNQRSYVQDKRAIEAASRAETVARGRISALTLNPAAYRRVLLKTHGESWGKTHGESFSREGLQKAREILAPYQAILRDPRANANTIEAAARATIIEAWERVREAMARRPTVRELVFIQAIARGESYYGRGWQPAGAVVHGITVPPPGGVGSNNWGAVTAGDRWSGARFQYPDTTDGTDKTARLVWFKAFPTPVEGAANTVYELARRNGVLEAARAGDLAGAVQAMKATNYFGLSAEAYLRAVKKNVAAICNALGESDPFASGGGEHVRGKEETSGAVVAAVVAAVGVALVLFSRKR